MDALSLVVIDAINNTYRGARAVVGPIAPSIVRFEKAVPDIRNLRNRLEHFDAYLRGRGTLSGRI